MVGAQSNLAWGKTLLPEIMYEILAKCPNFTRHLSGKCPNFTLFARKNIFRDFGGVVEEGNPLAPVSYAYGWAPGPHQLNPALQINVTVSDERIRIDRVQYLLSPSKTGRV